MTDESDGLTSGERRVGAIIAAYLGALDRGETPDRDAFLREHAAFAGELASFFADQDQLYSLVGQVGGETASFADSVPPPATTIARRFGDYELLEEIGRGGMGVVFRARQVSLGRLVAVKVVLAADIASADELRRFRREAETVARLEHPHIIPIYETGAHQGHPYFSMPLLEGRSLAGPAGRLADNLRAAAEVVAAVAGAVHHAHCHGVLHRDLKPANVLLDEFGRPLVADFGLAKLFGGDTGGTPSGAVVGTPAYIAPEQARADKALTPAADVYGLGAVLYELLTGRPPFQAATPLDTLLQVLDREPDRPRKLNPKIDRGLEVVRLKCLEKDPARRYGSAEALADDLGRWLRGEPVAARPAGPVRRVAMWVRRRPAVAVLFLVIALASAAGVFWRQQEGSRERQVMADLLEKDLQKRRYPEIIREVAGLGAGLNGNRRAKELLDSCPPELRTLEWHCLKGLWRGPEVADVPPGLFDFKSPAPRLPGVGGGPSRADRILRDWAPGGPGSVVENGDILLSATADGKPHVTCDLNGQVRIWGPRSGGFFTLPNVTVVYPHRTFQWATINGKATVTTPLLRDEVYEALRRCVQMVDGESLSWCVSLSPGTVSVYVCDIRPGKD